MITKID